MFHSAVEAAQNSWSIYGTYTLLHAYKVFQKRFMETYSPYGKYVERYRAITKREVYPITEEYLSNNKIAEENISLLRNAIELWRSASKTTDAIAPLLFHYSWHCFNAFFAYSFFRWEPQHGSSHGIEIPSKTMNGNLEELTIRFRKEDAKKGETKGLFQRVIDTWILLGASPAFSAFLPVVENSHISLSPNHLFLLKDTKSILLTKLIEFDPVNDYERKWWRTYGRKNLIQNTSFSNSMNLPTKFLQSYLVLFVASSIARYRPILWASILSGEGDLETRLSIAYQRSLFNYAQYGTNNHSFLDQMASLLNDLVIKKFNLKKLS